MSIRILVSEHGAVITEKAISEKMFKMDFKITHPLFGRTFSYHGDFSIDK
ncbi:MAG: DUF4166 domain-containing protein [Candidatus Thiodiazotropha sp.]|nr:DUF4166 domain-containing protein [Candidatus Thiodiazotropha sp.]MCM8921870.1 DUF4166 domain-containing protein [Candidatus Thiodiazotropha sp.]